MIGSRIAFTVDATGADMYLCMGFIPDWVHIRNLDDATNMEELFWSRMLREPESVQGIVLKTTTDVDKEAIAETLGVEPYYGGHVVTAAESAAETYFVPDPVPDKRSTGTGSTIDTWTLGSAANRTGNFNDVADITGSVTRSPVGIGSRMNVDGRWYTIMVLSSNGEAANEVEVAEAAPPSGSILYLSGRFDFVSADANQITRQGIKLDANHALNTDADTLFVEAGRYM